jgi:Na+/H+ antiporter NhaC
VDHVRTQLPYAFLAAGLGIILGDLGTALGLPVWIALLLGVGVLVGVLKLLGTSVNREDVGGGIAS